MTQAIDDTVTQPAKTVRLKHRWAGAEWLKRQGLNPEMVSPLGCQVADILGLAYRGLYHVGNDTILYRKAEWYKPNVISLHFDRSMATFDGSELTQLVLWCHRFSIRLEIRPVMMKRAYEGQVYDNPELELTFSRRKLEGKWHERHPGIEEAIAKFEQYVEEVDDSSDH